MNNNTLTLRTAFVVVIASILSALLVGWLVMGIGLATAETPTKFYTFLSVIIGQGFMLVPLLGFLKLRNEPIVKRLRLNPVSKNIALCAASLALGLTVLSDELDRVIQIVIPQPDYILDLNITLQPESAIGFILLFLAIVIIAPVGEELLFRGFLQQFLEQHWKDVTRAILVTSLFFAIIHMNSYWLIQIYILGIFLGSLFFAIIHMNSYWLIQIYILGIFLGYLSWRTGSVIPSLILHAINNGTALIFSFTELNLDNIYLWHDHVAPWIIILSIGLFTYGFKGINLTAGQK